MMSTLLTSYIDEMQSIKGLVVFAMLLVSIRAAPLSVTASTPNDTSPNVLFKPAPNGSNNDCGDSSFVNQSSGGSPTVGDCLQIAANIGGGGSWEVENAAQSFHQLVQYGSCAFGVQGHSGSSPGFNVGNQDIIDLIHSSVDKFAWNGLVGSKGDMPCQGIYANDNVGVSWGLFHT
jgi:hypothetical protein